MSRQKKLQKIKSPDIHQNQSQNEDDFSGKLITATELRNLDKRKYGKPSRQQNIRVNKTARDFE